MNSEAQDVLTAIFQRELGPLRADIATLTERVERLSASLGMTNGSIRPLGSRVAELEGRIDALELADTERPSSFVDSAEPGGEG